MNQDVMSTSSALMEDMPAFSCGETAVPEDRRETGTECRVTSGTWFATLLLLPMLSMFAVFQGVIIVLVPAQLVKIDPANKIANLGLLIVIGSIAAIAGLLAGGAVSDRTRTRWGKRAPWLVIMSVMSAVALMAMSAMSSVTGLIAAGVLLWFCANYYQAAVNALVPERVPAAQLGRASAILGLGVPLGIVVGINMAARLSQSAAYASLAALFLIATLLFIFLAPEPPSSGQSDRAKPERTITTAALIIEFLSSFRSRDFTLVFISRSFVFLSYFTVSGYLYYILQDYIGAPNVPENNVSHAVGTASTLTTLCWIPTALFAGWLADRLNRLKLFVGICSLGLMVTMLIPFVSPTWPGILVFAGLQGASMGTYFGIDLALMSLVLPDKEAQGRDMALLQIGGSGIAIIAPAIAAILIESGGYSSLFVFGASTAFLGGVSVLLVRSIR